MPRILLTGFEPFGNNTTNVSRSILKQIEPAITLEDPWYNSRPGHRVMKNIDIMVEKQLLTVDEVGSNAVAKRIENGESWDFIIQMGLCEVCDRIRFELTAQNKLDMRIPDNSGRKVTNQVIGQTNLYANNSLVKSLSHPPLENVIVSNDAGTYVCNETYYRTLAALSNRVINDSVNAYFIHFPSSNKLSVQESIEKLKQILGRIFYKPVIDVVGALVIDDNKIMLARRNDTSEMPGLWEFPGGKIENGESDFEAIIREMDEELGWTVSPIRTVSSIYHEYPDFAINLKLVEVAIDNSECMVPNSKWTSHDEIAWFTDIEGVDVAQADFGLATSILKVINAK